MPDPLVDDWLIALERRHHAALTSSEFLKAVRALSVRYVEKRAALSGRSALDSSGKRAAFAAFYAPLHFLTAREILRAIGARDSRETRPVPERIIDLGCGTGAASAAWALEWRGRPVISGVDLHPWAIDESEWTWTRLGLRGHSRRGDLVQAAGRLLAEHQRIPLFRTAVIAAWSVNEVTDAARQRLLPSLLGLAHRGTRVLLIEPLARAGVRWWGDWSASAREANGRVDEWRFDVELPEVLATLSEAAGFHRETLGARSLWLGG